MPTPPRRARFQIHLSTAIVLMFVAGGLIWENVTPRIENRLGVDSNWWPHHFYGWPMLAVEFMPEDGYWHLYAGNLVIDILIALAIPAVAWVLCEDWIRWRAARKGA